MLIVACWLLCVICCLLFVVSFVDCCLSFTNARCPLYAFLFIEFASDVCCTLFVVR